MISLENRVDFIVLAECEIPIGAMLEALNKESIPKYSAPLNFSQSLTILTTFPPESIRSMRDTGGVAIRRLIPPVGVDVLIVALHLPSKLHLDEMEQALFCTRIVRFIEEAEQEVGHDRTIVLGDLNMNPFEHGLVAAEGFHAVMNRAVATKNMRIVYGEKKRFFYNPMWTFFGDTSPGPPGTYYYNSSNQINYYWHVFDQVLVRPSLLTRFSDYDLEILTSVGSTSLLSEQLIPDRRISSDHLPILFELNIGEEATK